MKPATRRILRQACVKLGIFGPAIWLNDKIRFPGPGRAQAHAEAVAFYRQFITPGDLVFDCGANMGLKTKTFLACGATVVAVEPQPHLVGEIRALHGRNPRLTLVQAALGREPGRATLSLHDIDGVASLKRDWTTGWRGEISVEVTTMDHLIERFGTPKFVKMDIEGSEPEALAGLTRGEGIEYFSIEVSHQPQRVDSMNRCLEMLSRLGTMSYQLTSQESMVSITGGWIDEAEFRRFWVEERDRLDGWGDLYVRFG
jgi:FkbM family methyltransferase